jgi:hypothetical protein
MAAEGSLMTALLAVQSALPENPIRKDKENEQFKRGGKASKYVSLDAVMDVVLPLLNQNQLVWITLPGAGEHGEPTLAYRLIHADTGEALTGEMPLLLARQDPQGFGSAITYARRYSLMSVLGLTADEDDDGNAASGKSKPKAETVPKQANGQLELASEQDVAEIREAAQGLERDQIKLAMAASGLPAATRADQVPRDKVVAVIKALGMSERSSE